MASSQTSYHDIYVNEFDMVRIRFFRQNSPWTSSPVLSVLVVIALSTFVAFYMQARSLTRTLRPTVSGVPTRLPATIVWGLFSLQYSQLSQYVQAERAHLHGLASTCLYCSGSQVFPGLPYVSMRLELANRYLPQQFVTSYRAKKHQLSRSSQSLSQIDKLSAFLDQQLIVPNTLRSAVEPTADEVSQQADDMIMRYSQGKRTTVSSGLGKSLIGVESCRLPLCHAMKSTDSPNREFVDHIHQNPMTPENIVVETFSVRRRNVAEVRTYSSLYSEHFRFLFLLLASCFSRDSNC